MVSFASALLLAFDAAATPLPPPETPLPVPPPSLMDATVSATASGLMPAQETAKKAAETLGEEASRELKSQVEAQKKKIDDQASAIEKSFDAAAASEKARLDSSLKSMGKSLERRVESEYLRLEQEVSKKVEETSSKGNDSITEEERATKLKAELDLPLASASQNVKQQIIGMQEKIQEQSSAGSERLSKRVNSMQPELERRADTAKKSLDEQVSVLESELNAKAMSKIDQNVESETRAAVEAVTKIEKALEAEVEDGKRILDEQVEKKKQVMKNKVASESVESRRLIGKFLDQYASVRVDGNTENTYWVFGPELPYVGQIRVPRKETSDVEVIIGGFIAGSFVELSLALMLHPLDTLKTRLQRGSQASQPANRNIYLQRLFDGLGPVLATVPALSTFWAVKDVVRRQLITTVQPLIPLPVLSDILATSVAAACGEAAYIAVKTPGQVLKTQQQVAAVDEEAGDILQVAWPEDLGEASLRSFPVLATVDVPQVGIRTGLFVALHDSNLYNGPGSEILLFTIASTAAAFMCTPLDVARTQLLLSRRGVEDLPATLASIGTREGFEGLTAGWLPRLLWNGVTVGLVLGLCRLQYEDARTLVLVEVLDRLQEIIQPIFAQV